MMAVVSNPKAIEQEAFICGEPVEQFESWMHNNIRLDKAVKIAQRLGCKLRIVNTNDIGISHPPLTQFRPSIFPRQGVSVSLGRKTAPASMLAFLRKVIRATQQHPAYRGMMQKKQSEEPMVQTKWPEWAGEKPKDEPKEQAQPEQKPAEPANRIAEIEKEPEKPKQIKPSSAILSIKDAQQMIHYTVDELYRLFTEDRDPLKDETWEDSSSMLCIRARETLCGLDGVKSYIGDMERRIDELMELATRPDAKANGHAAVPEKKPEAEIRRHPLARYDLLNSEVHRREAIGRMIEDIVPFMRKRGSYTVHTLTRVHDALEIMAEQWGHNHEFVVMLANLRFKKYANELAEIYRPNNVRCMLGPATLEKLFSLEKGHRHEWPYADDHSID